MSEDRSWLNSFMEMHLEIQDALKAKRELDEINLLLKSLDVGQVPGYQPLSAIQGIRKLHRAWQQLAQGADVAAKTATDFLQKNEALRAENAKLRESIAFLDQQLNAANRVHFTNRQDIEAKNYELVNTIANQRERITGLEKETAEAWAAVKEGQAENAKLREEAESLNRYFAAGVKLTGEKQALQLDIAKLNDEVARQRTQLAQLQEEYANRGAIIQDFAKREYGHQKLIAELEKQIGHMEQAIKEFFPAPIIPAPWEFDPMRIPQGEWVLRSNEALRNRVVELGRQCALNEATARQWKANYERQMAINASQRSRIGELRLQLRRIADERVGGVISKSIMANMALQSDDRSAARPITDIITQEAP